MVNKATTRLSLKTIAFRFPPGSMERVYLHGIWQKSRGRNPSLLFGNHTDTLTAFESAKEGVGDYLEKVRRLPFSRHWPWSNHLVHQIRNRAPVSEIATLGWH